MRPKHSYNGIFNYRERGILNDPPAAGGRLRPKPGKLTRLKEKIRIPEGGYLVGPAAIFRQLRGRQYQDGDFRITVNGM